MSKILSDIHDIWWALGGVKGSLAKFWSWTYEEKWQWIFGTLLKGTFCRFFAVIFLILSLWFAIKRRNLVASLTFFVIMLCFMYGAQVMQFIGLL
jgi:hypothetical protein